MILAHPRSLLWPVAVVASFHCTSARAGLAEATDYSGVWTSGSTHGSTTAWAEQSAVSADGRSSARGEVPAANLSAWMQTTVTGPTTLYFSHRVVAFYDGYGTGRLSVSVSNVPTTLATTASEPITTDWKEHALAIPAGESIVRWTLGTSSSRGPPSGEAFIDQVWTSEDSRPRITSVPDQTGTFDTPFTWVVPVSSSTPATLTPVGLPPGLEIDPATRTIRGIPASAGEFDATVAAANAAGEHVTRVHFKIEPGLTSIAEGIDSPALVFTPVGNSFAWTGVTGLGHDGVDCVRGTAGRAGGALLSTVVNGPGTLSFWYQTEDWWGHPLSSYSELLLYVNRSPSESPHPSTGFANSGGPVWFRGTAEIPPAAGPQTVYWRSYGPDPGQPPGTPAHFVYLDEVVFVPSVIPPQSTFAAWQQAWNVSGQPPTADLDNDGLTLVTEYAFGGSPHVANPELSPVASVVDRYFTIRVTKAPSPTDLNYFVQGSKDLVANAWTTSSIEVLDEDGTRLLARCKKPVSEQPACYIRVKVLVDP